MSQSFQDLQNLIAQHDARFIDLKLVDLLGKLRHLTLPVEAVTESVLTDGTGFDGSSYGFKKVQASDMVMIPDIATARLDPFREARTLSMYASAHVADDSLSLSDQDSRGILQRALNLLFSTGLADDLLCAPEYEFYIFQKVDIDISTSAGSFRVHGEESQEQNAYHLINPEDRYDDFRDQAVRLLVDLKMPVRYHHHEGGGYGQQEIEFALEPMLSAADHAIMVRYVLANLAARAGLHVTFMPKPLYNQAGSGWHTHQMLRKNGVNLFWDPQGLHGLSGLALNYLGGWLDHACALSAFVNASTNSYKRLNSGFEAPNAIVFGPANRMAAVRIPRWARGTETRIEYRPGDFAGNPYLSLAAMILAGVDGLRRGVDPIERGFGPAETMKESDMKRLPATLDAALDALQTDHAFLVSDGVFSESVLSQWISKKREECQAVGARPHPYEFRLYF